MSKNTITENTSTDASKFMSKVNNSKSLFKFSNKINILKINSKKAGIEISWMEVLGLILGILVVLLFLRIGYGLWSIFWGGIDQGTIQTFDDLNNKIKNLKDSDQHSLYLKNGYILVGFNKGSKSNEYLCNYGSWTGGKSTVRPPACQGDSTNPEPACLCLCGEKSFFSPCNPAEKCQKFENIEQFYASYNENDNNFGKVNPNGEDLVLFNACDAFSSRPITHLELVKENNNVRFVTEPSK